MDILVLMGEVGVSSVLSELPGEEGVIHSSLSWASASSPSSEELGGGSLSSGFSGGFFQLEEGSQLKVEIDPQRGLSLLPLSKTGWE